MLLHEGALDETKLPTPWCPGSPWPHGVHRAMSRAARSAAPPPGGCRAAAGAGRLLAGGQGRGQGKSQAQLDELHGRLSQQPF